MASSQQSFKRRYPHIAPEIVAGSGRQSVQSDVFSLGRIVLSILDLLPTAIAMSLRIAKRAILDNPVKRPSIEALHCKCKRRPCSNDFGYCYYYCFYRPTPVVVIWYTVRRNVNNFNPHVDFMLSKYNRLFHFQFLFLLFSLKFRVDLGLCHS